MNSKNTNMSVSDEVAAGIATYTKFNLLFYDIIVMLFENHLVWKCPTRKIRNFYKSFISPKHLDVGVGTGYFLDNCGLPIENQIIHLMDLNNNSLEKTSKRIKRYSPVLHRWNILEPIKIDLPQFDSICISNLLHCLPGNLKNKEIVFANLKPFMKKNSTLFGLTILGKNVKGGVLSKLFNGIYNKQGIFSNADDCLEDLENILKSTMKIN